MAHVISTQIRDPNYSPYRHFFFTTDPCTEILFRDWLRSQYAEYMKTRRGPLTYAGLVTFAESYGLYLNFANRYHLNVRLSAAPDKLAGDLRWLADHVESGPKYSLAPSNYDPEFYQWLQTRCETAADHAN